MSTENKEELNDGIVELDNRLPNWWLATLYGTIVFAAAYFFYYSMWGGPTLVEEYERAHALAEAQALARAAAAPQGSGEDLRAVVADGARRKEGDEVFHARCVSCHGTAGGGGIGPNLTDDYWLHGGQLDQIAHTIATGVAEKGMPPWGPVLTPHEIGSLVAFIRSLHGSHPANAKAPQGTLEKSTE